MHKTLVALLVCPVCHGELKGRIAKEDEVQTTEGEFECKSGKRKYPAVDSIGEKQGSNSA